MKDYLISMYIDDELDLEQKIEFVGIVHQDKRFTAEALSLLEQEKLLHAPVADQTPAVQIRPPRTRPVKLFRPLRMLAPVAAAAALWFLFLMPTDQTPGQIEKEYRFVLFHPGAAQVDISGSFTQWRRHPMKPAGNSGYWEVTLPLAGGEHRYAFILDSHEHIPDPTLPAREQDDFGSQNSILNLEV